jgi:hypothetical protein
MLQFSEHLNVASLIDGFPFQQKISNMHPLASQKMVHITQLTKVTVLAFLLLLLSSLLRYAFPFHALSFYFWVKMMDPVFITSCDVEQEVTPLAVCG